jgi:hypothetical protein
MTDVGMILLLAGTYGLFCAFLAWCGHTVNKFNE